MRERGEQGRHDRQETEGRQHEEDQGEEELDRQRPGAGLGPPAQVGANVVREPGQRGTGGRTEPIAGLIDASDFMKNMLKALASGSRPDSIMWRR